MRLIKYLGWNECSFDEYKQVSGLYGFNNETSPSYIDFARNNGGDFKFYMYRKGAEPLGACCVDNGWLCNDIKNPKSQTQGLMIPHFSVLIPFCDNINYILPFKSKCLAHRSSNPINASFNIFSKRDVAVAKHSSTFSRKTISTRNREERKFVLDGGKFVSISELSFDEICDIYRALYSLRRGGEGISPLNESFIRCFKNNLFGDVAFLNDEPVAFQMNLSSESKRGHFVDFINIGYDLSLKKHSLGTLIMWRNLKLAEAYSMENKIDLTYSFGAMSGEYKTRWCNPTRVGRLIT